jgi:Domain of unknown function DUF29
MPDDIKAVSSYERDFSAWALAQAAALRAVRDAVASAGRRRVDLEPVLRTLDWDNLAEEIEGLARRDRRELASRIVTIMEHLAKLENSLASEPRRGWIDTVEREREEALEIMRDSPSLRREIPGLIARRTRAAVRRALGDLVSRGEMSQAAAARIKPDYTEERVLGDWLPEPPASPQVRNGRRRRADA